MTWSAPHTFSYSEVLTSANLNSNFAILNEMAAAKFTAKGQILAATGANAGAVVPVTAAKIGYGIVYDSAQAMGSKYTPLFSIWDSKYVPYTLTASSAETTVWSYSLAAGALPAKAILRFRAYYLVSNGTASNQSVTLKFQLGSTAASMTGVQVLAGVTGARIIEGVIVPKNSLVQQFIGLYESSSIAAAYANSTENLASALTLKLTAQHSTNSASMTSYLYGGLLEYSPEFG